MPKREREKRGQGMRQRWELEDAGERQGSEEGGYLPLGDKGLPLCRGETDVAYGQMAVFKGKLGTPVLG